MHLTCEDKKYGNHSALKEIDLSFMQCGLIAVLGPSGSGKSTLLNILGMLDPAYKGTIIIGDQIVPKTEKNMGKYRSKAIAFIFQECNLISSLTVKENIITSLELSGTAFKVEKYEEIMNRFHVLKFENRVIGTLSGGEKQRIAIVRALLRENSIILADEPTGNLDEENSISIMNALKEISKDHLVIVVTHNAILARDYADRIISLRDAMISHDEDLGYSCNPALSNPLDLSIPRLKLIWYLTLSLRNFLLRRKKILPIILSMTLALLCIATVLGFFNGIGNLVSDVNLSILESDKVIVRNYGNSLFKTIDITFLQEIEQMAEWNKVIAYYDSKVNLSNNNKTVEVKLNVMDDSTFLQDRIQLLAGTFIKRKAEVLLEEETIQSLFVDTDCIGKSIELKTDLGFLHTCKIAGIYRANNEENRNIVMMSKELNASLSANSLSFPRFIGYVDEQSDKNMICQLKIDQSTQQVISGNDIDISITNSANDTVRVLVNASGFNYLLHVISPQYAPIALSDILTNEIPQDALNSVIGQEITLQKFDLTAFAKIKVEGICTEPIPSNSLIFYFSQQAADILNQPQINIVNLYLKDYSIQDRNALIKLFEQKNITYEMASDKTGSLVMEKMSVIGIILILITFIVLLLSCLMVHFSVKISVMDRTYEAGILKSLGATNMIIFRIFTLDNMLLGLLVSIITCILVILANTTHLTTLLAIDRVSIYQFQLWHYIPILFIGCFITIISGLKETIMVSRLSIIEAIRHKNI